MRSWTYSRTAAAAAALLAAGLLAACGGVSEQRVGDDDQQDEASEQRVGDDQRDEVTERLIGNDGLRLFVHGRTTQPSGGMDALVGGALTVADGCVLLDEGENQYPVVWPSGTAVASADPLVIELPSGDEAHLGDEIQGGGGFLEAGRLGIDVPDECLNEWGEVAVFNPDDDPAVNGS